MKYVYQQWRFAADILHIIWNVESDKLPPYDNLNSVYESYMFEPNRIDLGRKIKESVKLGEVWVAKSQFYGMAEHANASGKLFKSVKSALTKEIKAREEQTNQFMRSL